MMSTAILFLGDTYDCPSCDALRHRKEKGSHSTPKYGLLFSANAGCLPCVRYWVEREGVSLDSASDNHSDWDVRSYALQCTNEVERTDVLRYLDASGTAPVDSGANVAAEPEPETIVG